MPAVNIPFSDLASTPDLLNMDGDQIGNWMRACFAHAKPYQVEIEKVKSISMLAPDVLFYIGLLACVLRGRIIEIGPYIGGSTVALASGSGTAHPPVITIEAGGSYETHPDLPSSDILGDLRINLENFEVVDRVNIIEGFANDIVPSLGDYVDPKSVQLVLIDADGDVISNLTNLRPFLMENCILIIDDYTYEEKGRHFRNFIDIAVRQGWMEPFGVFGYGTWIGRIRGELPAILWKPRFSHLEQDSIIVTDDYAPEEKGQYFRSFIDLAVQRGWMEPLGDVGYGTWIGRINGTLPAALWGSRFSHVSGHCYSYPLKAELADSKAEPNRSSLILTENSTALGPPHSVHSEIMEQGQGRFSHWTDGQSSCLYFSTSDNSDPNDNGWQYAIELNGTVTLILGFDENRRPV